VYKFLDLPGTGHLQGCLQDNISRARDGTIPLLTSRVPNLCLDSFPVLRRDRPGRELHSDRRFGVHVELIAREFRE